MICRYPDGKCRSRHGCEDMRRCLAPPAKKTWPKSVEDIEKEAKRIEQRINDLISAECKKYHPFQWDEIARRAVDRELDTDSWDYHIHRFVGNAPPQIALTRYTPPEFRQERDFPVDR